MGSFDDNFIYGFFDSSFINDVPSPNFSLVHSLNVDIDFSQTGSVLQEPEFQKQSSYKSHSFKLDFSQTGGTLDELDYEMDCPMKSSNVDIEFSQTGSVLQEPECRKQSSNKSYSFELNFSQTGGTLDELDYEMDCPKKRGRTDTNCRSKTKAHRERERREKLNESFLGLSLTLEPGRAAKTDKLAVLNDAIRVVKQLRTEAVEYKMENRKLLEEIESLKAEKNELREEKLTLKAEKEMMEQQFIAAPVPSPGLVSPYSARYHGRTNKMALYPSYGMYPMWHYLPQATRDTSRDHESRPPAA